MIFFVHIPKNAGTSTIRYLEKQYGTSFLNISHPMVEKRGDEIGCHFVDKFDDREIACKTEIIEGQYGAVGGHICFSNIQFYSKPNYVFALVREPVERIVSQYFYVHHNVNGGKPNHYIQNSTLETYVKNYSKRSVWFNNEQCYFLRDNDFDTKVDIGKVFRAPPDHTPSVSEKETAFKCVDAMLEKYDFIGTVDNIQSSFNKIAKDLKKSRMRINVHNSGVYSKDEALLSERQRECIREKNWLDEYLYQAVKSKFKTNQNTFERFADFIKLVK